jgi:hypothetical protein
LSDDEVIECAKVIVSTIKEEATEEQKLLLMISSQTKIPYDQVCNLPHQIGRLLLTGIMSKIKENQKPKSRLDSLVPDKKSKNIDIFHAPDEEIDKIFKEQFGIGGK